MSRRLAETPGRRGQAMVEFAIVLPIFILLLVGIIDGGRVIFANNQLAEIAREGARYGSVQGRSVTTAGRNDIAAETLSRVAGMSNVQVTVSCERGGVTVTTCRTGDILSVAVQADMVLATPLLGNLMGNPTLSATSNVMVNQ
jgi:Flp pilus assembly protein TadG